jgi:hypothetical protein
MSLAYVRSRYGVPAKRGGRIYIGGKMATIVGSRDGRLRVRLEEDADKRIVTAHPTWNIRYADPKPAAIVIKTVVCRPNAETMSRDEARTHAYALTDGREIEVETVAAMLHFNESLHMHENVSDQVPCAYCYLRAGRAIKAMTDLGDGAAIAPSSKRAICPECGNSFSMTQDGRMRRHLGSERHGGRRSPCKGWGQKPVRPLPVSFGIGKGPTDLSERDGSGDEREFRVERGPLDADTAAIVVAATNHVPSGPYVNAASEEENDG